MHLTLMILATIGLTWILVKSSIFKPLRESISRKVIYRPNIFLVFLDSILNCEGCMGFWSGAIVYVLDYLKVEILLYCFAGSFVCLIGLGLLKLINSK